MRGILLSDQIKRKSTGEQTNKQGGNDMSKRCEVTITCPKCNEEHPFVMWQSINTQLDPEMRAAVKDRSAFQFICPTCGEKTYVDYGFLYHQMEDGIMIHYASSDEDAEEIYKMVTNKEQDGLFHDMLDADYLIRIVRSQNELREKISIFDEGLDDRIIEIIKLFLGANAIYPSKKAKYIPSPPSKGIGFLCIFLFSFGTSIIFKNIATFFISCTNINDAKKHVVTIINIL